MAGRIRLVIVSAVVATVLICAACQFAMLQLASAEAGRAQVLAWARLTAAQLVDLSVDDFQRTTLGMETRPWDRAGSDTRHFAVWSRALMAEAGVLATAVTDRIGNVLASWPPNADVGGWLGDPTDWGPVPLVGPSGRLYEHEGDGPIASATVAVFPVARGPALTPELYVHVVAQPLSGWSVPGGSAWGLVLGALALSVLVVVTSLRHLRRRVLGPLADLGRQLMAAYPGNLSPRTGRDARGSGGDLEMIALNVGELCKELEHAHHRTDRLKRSIDSVVKHETRQIHTQLKRAERDAEIDALTGLVNRRFIEKRLDDLFRQQVQEESDLTIAMFDVDNFKTLNDTDGHAAGDDVLRFLGELLIGALRENDVGIRYGGDEFMVVLVGVGSRQAYSVCERIVRMFSQRVSVMDIQTPVTLSAGVASLHGTQIETAAELLAQADQALYQSKRGGKNLVSVARASLPHPWLREGRGTHQPLDQAD